MSALLAFPILILAGMLQMAVFSRIQLLSGSADILLLLLAAWGLLDQRWTAWIWALTAAGIAALTTPLPPFVPFLTYGLVMALARVLQRRFWQSPLLALFMVIFVGTLMQHGIYLLVLMVTGVNIGIATGLSRVTFPSLVLNAMFALPVFLLVRDLAWVVYPEEVEA